jgi:predicted transcriptional regulator
VATPDPSLDRLLDLAGEVLVISEDGEYWVKFEAWKVAPTPAKPHGVAYSLTLQGVLDASRRGPGRERCRSMNTLRIGIASYERAKARTMAIARGEHKPQPDEPKVWFPSIESVAKVLSAGNRELLQVIIAQRPGSIDELSKLTGRQKSNLSRTLRTMEGYGIVHLERGEHGRIVPSVTHERFTVDLSVSEAIAKS